MKIILTVLAIVIVVCLSIWFWFSRTSTKIYQASPTIVTPIPVPFYPDNVPKD